MTPSWRQDGRGRDRAGLLQTAVTATFTVWLSQSQFWLCLLPWPLSRWLSGWQDNILSHHLEKCLWASPLYASSHPDVMLLPWSILCPRHHFSSLSMDSYLSSHSPSPQLCKPLSPEGDQGSTTCLSILDPKSALSGNYTGSLNLLHPKHETLELLSESIFTSLLLRNSQTNLAWTSFKRGRLNDTFTMKNCSVNS